MLSKSRYLKGLKCHKALWLYQFKRNEAFYPPSTEHVFTVGNQAGELAQHYFPGGQLALVGDFPNSAASVRTQQLLEQGETTIYEATFIANHTLVALDILHQIDGKWYGFEVKSTNSTKEEHVRDAAIQYHVIREAGLELEDIAIMHFDRDYVRQGPIDVHKLFTYESVYHKIGNYLNEIPANIETFMEVFNQDEPTILIGNHCDKPYPCEFANYCHRLQENQEILEGIKDQKLLSTEVVFINQDALKDYLKTYSYPIYSLDFETIQYGIPEFNNSRPYQQIPFQYSLHYQKSKDSKPEHFEFLGNGLDDPREDLIKYLVETCGNEGPILVYNIAFERTIIRQLIRDFPANESALLDIEKRLVDLMPVFKKMVKTEMTSKSASLKVVLPTFLPKEKDYSNLDIQQGMETVQVYRELPTLADDEAETARQQMLAYCKMDTEAVLKLYQKLFEFI